MPNFAPPRTVGFLSEKPVLPSEKPPRWRALLPPSEKPWRPYFVRSAPSEKPWARSENWAVHCESLGGGGGNGSSCTERTSVAAVTCETSVASRAELPRGGNRPRAASSAMVLFTA